MYVIRATYIPRDDIHFDRDYYLKNYIPLAKRLIDRRVNYLQIQAEFDMRDLMQGDELQSPCVMVLLVETAMVPMVDNPDQPMDFWMNMRWDAPAHMVIDVGITPRGSRGKTGSGSAVPPS
jgi:hypothetical protein